MNKAPINNGFRKQPNDETLINNNQSSQYNSNPQKIHNIARMIALVF